MEDLCFKRQNMNIEFAGNEANNVFKEELIVVDFNGSNCACQFEADSSNLKILSASRNIEWIDGDVCISLDIVYWILVTGIWNDSGQWMDDDSWKDN